MTDWGTQPAQPPQVPQMSVEERNALIKSWLVAKTDRKTIENREVELRGQVSNVLFPTPKKGTQRFQLGDGYAVKLVYKLNFKLGDAEATNAAGDKIPVNVQVENLMDEIEKLGNEGAFLVDRLIKTKHELSESEYAKLDESNPTHKAIKAMIDKLLTITPATPALEFEEPKPK